MHDSNQYYSPGTPICVKDSRKNPSKERETKEMLLIN